MATTTVRAAFLVFVMLFAWRPGAAETREPAAGTPEPAAGVQDATGAPEGVLRWHDLDVQARLDADGVLHVTEQATLLAFGSVPTAARALRGWIGTTIRVARVARAEGGTSVPVRHEVVDDGFTLRWVVQAPGAAPFAPDTRLVYRIDYTVSGGVIPAWGVPRFGSASAIPPFFLDPRIRAAELWRAWRLAPRGWARPHLVDYDFSPLNVGGDGTVDHASVAIAFDRVWGSAQPFRREWRPVAAGVDLRGPIAIDFRGDTPPAAVSRALHAAWLAPLVLLPAASLGLWGAALARRWRQKRRYEQEPMDAGWIDLHVTRKEPGEIRMLVEGTTGGRFYGGARATLEEMARQGRIEAREEAGAERLQLRAERHRLTPWERAIVESLFGTSDTVDVGDAERRAREGSLDLDAVGGRAYEAAQLKATRFDRRAIPTAALVLLGVGLMLGTLQTGGFAALAAGLVVGSFVYQASGLVGTRASLPAHLPLAPLVLLLVPVLLFAAAFALFFLGVLAHPTALAGLAAFWLGLINSLLNKTAPPWSEAVQEARYGLDRARRHIAAELRQPVPSLDGRWLPWILALGLEEDVKASGWTGAAGEAPPSEGWAARLTAV